MPGVATSKEYGTMTETRQVGMEHPGTKRRGAFLRLLAVGALALAGRRDAGDGSDARGDAGAERGRRPADPRRLAPGRGKDGRGAGDDRRGRSAVTPSQIPAAGWKDVLARVFHEVSADRILLVAAGVTFYVILAIFPALAAFVSIYGLFADPATISGHLGLLSNLLPGGALEIITEQVNRLVSQGRSELGLKLVIGLAISLWSANAGMKALFDALNVAYQEEEKRGFFKLNGLSLLFTLGALVAGLVTLFTIVVIPVALHVLGLEAGVETAVSLVRWPIIAVLVLLALALLYRYGPSRDTAKWRWVTWGSVVAAVLWLVFSVAFSFYVSRFGSYDATYGSLGAAIGFMTWIWLSTAVVLVGAELNAELEHQTARDTTTGPEKPLGTREAVMADSVAPASS
jgi:membrane protein